MAIINSKRSVALALLAACISGASAFVPTQRRAHAPLFSTLQKEEAIAEVVAPTNPRKEGLALMLDDGTRKSHSMAQNTSFVGGFFKGIGTKDAFSKLVTSLYFVYKAQEEAFDNINNEAVKSLDYKELRRVSSLEKDMHFFYGDDWQSKIQPSIAAKKYVARIEEITNSEESQLLIAHQYTRYLGDLFGGQMMGGMAMKSLGLKEGEGTSFYNFNDIPDTSSFIDIWYTNLNKLDLTLEQKNAIVEEANYVFDLNIEILEELEGSPFKAVLMMAINSLKEKRLWAFKGE